MAYFRSRSRRSHLFRLFIFFLFAIGLDLLRIRYHLAVSLSRGGEPPKDRRTASPSSSSSPTRKERIFIASTHWNSEHVLRSHWNAAVVALARALGPENVYVSVYESGSWDDTKGALRELDAALSELNVRRTIVLSDVSHEDEISQPPAPTGWIDTPRGRRELRRIPFLSRQRNASLQPLVDLDREGEQFDRILFLNDVVFNTDDFFTLLDTNHGEYAAACSLDFSKPPRFYDTFALRDLEGHEPLMQTWPYFRSRDSRYFIERGEPAPVASCWNGMVIMDAAPFYDTVAPLRFRGIADSLAAAHLEGSECCLIHADNPLSAKKGVWLNPNVRVGYDGKAYEAVHPQQHGQKGTWPSTSQVLWGLWENRLRRWFTTDALKTWIVRRRLRRWEKQDPSEQRVENGMFCLINEMQVLVANGWAHV